jgi:NADH-quinone oxidoreductase subunit N
MNTSDFLVMRHELLLVAMVLLLLFFELFSEKKKYRFQIPVFLFALILITGFLPEPTGTIFGGMYVNDGLRILMKNILNVGVFIVLLQSVDWMSSAQNAAKRNEYYILLISTLTGMNFMISAGEFTMFYLGLELATIPLAAVAAYDKYRSVSAEAGIKMILSSAFSSSVMLLGISFIYGSTGTLYFDELGALMNGNALQIIGLVFFFSGIAFKISLAPFHFWAPDVYERAPINVASYLSVISKGAAVFILILLLYTVFKNMKNIWQPLIYGLAALTMSIGNLFAMRQQNFKRFLAFSSIAQAGFILLGMIAGSKIGMASVVYFILIYLFSNLACFGVVSVIYEKTGKENMNDYGGFYKTNPKLSLVLMLGLFSLAGIPPAAGFFGKFFLFSTVASAGYYGLLFIAVVNATVSLYYYLLPIKAIFMNESEFPISKIESSNYAKVAFLLCVLGLVMIGFAGSLFEEISRLSFGI